MREVRDAVKEKLRNRYQRELQSLETKIDAAKQKLEKQGVQFVGSAFELGSSLLGMLLGNKRSRYTTTVRGLGRAAQQRSASKNGQEVLDQLLSKRDELVATAEAEIEELKQRYSVNALTLTAVDIPCRKSDTRIDLLALVWIPWAIDAAGQSQPLVDIA